MAHCLDNVGSLESICLYSISMIHQANILPTTQPWSRSASWIQGAVVSQVKRTCVSRCRRYLARHEAAESEAISRRLLSAREAQRIGRGSDEGSKACQWLVVEK